MAIAVFVLSLFAIALGLFGLVGAVLGWPWIYGFWDVLAVGAIFGEGAARVFTAIVGVICIGLGISFWFRFH